MSYTEQVKKYLEYCEYRKKLDWMNITVRQSRQSGVARATCPD